MKIINFNSLLIGNNVHDLSKIRKEIIEQECDRIGDMSVSYNGTIFHCDIRQGLSIYLSKLEFEVVDDNTIKLGDATINIPELRFYQYLAYDKVFSGNIKEIKAQVTEHLEKMEPRIASQSSIWLGDNFIVAQPNETFSEAKAHLIADEMKKIEKC